MTVTLPRYYPLQNNSGAPTRALFFSILVLSFLTVLTTLRKEPPAPTVIPEPPTQVDSPPIPQPPEILDPITPKTPESLPTPALEQLPEILKTPTTPPLPDIAGIPDVLGSGDEAVGPYAGAFDPEIPTVWLKNLPGVIQRGALVYPHDLKKAKIEGYVLLLIMIDERGKVRVREVLQATNPGFLEPAIQAAESSLFEPPTQNGKPVRSYFKLPFRFTLD